MFAQKTYNCTGPKCFSDFFDLNGIDKGMLLTVATRSDGYQEQLDLTHRMFGGRKRFLIAGSVPNCIANGEVENYLERVFVEKAISAVKVHPNACGLDLAAAAGKERLERILAACSRLGLPLVIHTGRSSFVEAASSNLADIRKFQDLNLNGKVPVVLAHAGAYGCPLREMEGSIVVVLKRILDRSLNVLVDVSALGREKMAILFSRISSERVLFGSDALYENQCVMLARLVCAMEKASAHPSEDLVTVLCKNPAEYLFRENPQKERLGQ
jgi:predicted TIM-barrel fold metal-dependent hydrolase